MKISFNPPLRPADAEELITILCPRCDSTEVYANTYVTGTAYVNVNTCELSEPPEDADCSIVDVRSERNRMCMGCGYEWGCNSWQ
ncbi:hypothetical protein GCM10010916_02480 [Paenibacillus abyssi]|uniref:Uncharacterized protein n=1 Tax=Paenibacillus abyssi TaxID=1340531 RepID=A0A917FK62_9BACL|nr:hypothetical protein GCM10010916_02480 [Paenibacillus abyssi]